MDKSLMMETAKTVGKLSVRGLAWVGTSIAVCGGGLLGTALYAGRYNNPIWQTGVMVIGGVGSFLAACAACNAVDKMLVEDYHLGFDYEKAEE